MFELRRVCAAYGDVTVVRDASLIVPDGAAVALLGPNGAGKTTLLRVASGLLRPIAGQILLDGRDVTGMRPHELSAAGICHVPEGGGVFPSLSVRDNLRLQVKSGYEELALEKAMTAFPQLAHRLGQVAGTLSGGEQRMLAAVRTYLQDPRVVLLDEISMGLAPRVIDEIFDFLNVLIEGGTSLVLVEQYITRAMELADYVFLLNKGAIRFAGEPSELARDEVFDQYVGASA